jgi:hypothetical protein
MRDEDTSDTTLRPLQPPHERACRFQGSHDIKADTRALRIAAAAWDEMKLKLMFDLRSFHACCGARGAFDLHLLLQPHHYLHLWNLP